MNSHNTDNRYFLATNIICVLVLTACLAIWLGFRGSEEPRDIYIAWGGFLLVLFVLGEWVLHLLKHGERIFAAINGWWEYIWLNCAGRLSPGGARHLIATGRVRHCGFQWRNGDAKVVPPTPED